MPNNLIFICGMGLLGLLVGSFLNVVIYRLPIILKREWEKDCLDYLKKIVPTKHPSLFLLFPRSHCPKCKKLIPWQQNIPLLSYALLGGKCSYCRTDIHWHYPAIEALSFFATLIVATKFGMSWQTIAAAILTWTLIAAAFIDWKHQLLPDNITLPLIWLGLLFNTKQLFTTPENAIIGAISGYLFLWTIARVFKAIRKVDGIGYGDLKLFSAFGAWFGWQMLPIILLMASFAGSVIGITLILSKKHEPSKPLPFGPYLAVAGWITFFWGQNILDFYLKLFA